MDSFFTSLVPASGSYLWVTDLHMDKKSEAEKKKMLETLSSYPAKALLITGDIAENTQTEQWLKAVEKELRCAIYFVLGNHDYYLETISAFSKKIATLSQESERLIYLPSKDYVSIEDQLALVGVDNWHLLSDSFLTSSIRPPDYEKIQDLKGLSDQHLIEYFEQKTNECCKLLEQKLSLAFAKVSSVILLIHVPPFAASLYYDQLGVLSPWQPYLTNEKIGAFLVDFMQKHPQKKLKILSGHTHLAASYIHEQGQIVAHIGMSSDEKLSVQALDLRVKEEVY